MRLSSRLPVALCLLLPLACTRPMVADAPGVLTELCADPADGTRRFVASLPVKRIGETVPLVLFIPPALHFPEMRTNGERVQSWFGIYDRYLNNAGIAFARHAGQAGSLDPAAMLAVLRRVLDALAADGDFAPVILLAPGSASTTALTLLNEGRADGAALVGPWLGPFAAVLDFRFLEDPFAHLLLCFDMDDDERVSAAEFERDVYRERESSYRGIGFAELDTNGDGFITRQEILARGRERLARLRTALSSGAFQDAAALLPEHETPAWVAALTVAAAPQTLLEGLRRPVVILHGVEDRHFPVAASRVLRGREGLTVKLYPAHDGDLNWDRYAEQGRISDGMLGLIETLFSLCGLSR